MDIFVIKKLEGKIVNIVAYIGGRCAVYSNIVYKFTSEGVIEFIDKKGNVPCYIRSDCIDEIKVVS